MNRLPAILTLIVIQLSLVLLSGSIESINAQSATWGLSPVDEDWITPQNWTPASVPTDTASFALSDVTDVFVSAFLTRVGTVVFSQGADPFTITALANSDLDFAAGGIINNSGIL